MLSQAGQLHIRKANILENRGMVISCMGRNAELAIDRWQTAQDAEAPYSIRSTVAGQSGDKVARGDKLSEWDPYTLASHC